LLQLVELADLGTDNSEHYHLFIKYHSVLNNLRLCNGGDVALHVTGRESLPLARGQPR